MSTKSLVIIIVVLVALLVGLSSVYTVREGQEALVLQLGKIKEDPTTKEAKIMYPGLHFKLPLIQQVHKFDVRLQTLPIHPAPIMTAELKEVIVDYYVKWRINNPALYYKRTGGSVMRAATLLQQQLNANLRAEFGTRNIKEVVSDDRSAIMNKLNAEADEKAEELGIDVVDVRIKSIDLPPEVSTAVFKRMRAERERVATEHRSEGKAQGERIRAQADANVTVTIAEANKKAAQIRASGNAQAAKIYANVYSKDPDFYAFYRSLQAYSQSFKGKNDILVLKPDSQFFDYFNNSTGKKSNSHQNG